MSCFPNTLQLPVAALDLLCGESMWPRTLLCAYFLRSLVLKLNSGSVQNRCAAFN